MVLAEVMCMGLGVAVGGRSLNRIWGQELSFAAGAFTVAVLYALSDLI